MAYVTPDEIREFCGLSADECPDERAEEAEAYARGVINDYCNTRFEAPESDQAYYYDGDSQRYLFAPDDDGPFNTVTAIEYWDGSDWAEYTGNYWLRAGGEYIELESAAAGGPNSWRVIAKCWSQIDENRWQVLKRVALTLCKLYLIARNEPLGPSIRSISMEGVSYTYQPVNEGNPTGILEVDYLLRSLRRNVIRS